MSRLYLNENEQARLSGLTHLQRCLYVFGIKPHMDFKTGLVGTKKRRISYQSLKEAVYVDPKPGIKNTGAPSREQLRRAVKGLERAGLIQLKSFNRHLIIYCTFADTDIQPNEGALENKLGQNKADINTTAKNELVNNQKRQKIKGKSPINPVLERLPKLPKADQPLLSDIYKNKAHNLKENLLPIPEDYYPSDHMIEQAQLFGCQPTKQEKLHIFINHCKSKALTSADWDSEYLKYLIVGKTLDKQWYSKQPATQERKRTQNIQQTWTKSSRSSEPRAAVNQWPFESSSVNASFAELQATNQLPLLQELENFKKQGVVGCRQWLQSRGFINRSKMFTQENSL